MFAAAVMFCAVSFNFQVDYSNCTKLADKLGPYHTEENCKIRANQIRKEFSEGLPLFIIASGLGHPAGIAATPICTSNGTLL